MKVNDILAHYIADNCYNSCTSSKRVMKATCLSLYRNCNRFIMAGEKFSKKNHHFVQRPRKILHTVRHVPVVLILKDFIKLIIEKQFCVEYIGHVSV